MVGVKMMAKHSNSHYELGAEPLPAPSSCIGSVSRRNGKPFRSGGRSLGRESVHGENCRAKLQGKAGLTLIEMLAVIVIIGILAAIILPAIQNARRRSHVTKAYSEIKQLKTAWRSYVSTYMNDSRVSGLPGGTQMDPAMVKVLLGTDVAANPDGIKFMDFPVNAATAGFLDPWGITYRITIDPLQSQTKTWTYATRVYCANRNPLE